MALNVTTPLAAPSPLPATDGPETYVYAEPATG